MSLDHIFTPRVKYVISAWVIVILFVIFQKILAGYYDPETAWSASDYLSFTLVQLVIGVLIILLFIIPIYDVVKKINSNFLKFTALITHAFGYGILYIVSLSLAKELASSGTESSKLKARIFELFFTDLHNSIKTYIIFIAILYAYDVFKKNSQSIIRQKTLENEIDKIKLESIRAQLQPHFLFNALNNVVALIDENKKKAQRSLIYLSDLLRYTIKLEPQKLIPINEEIQAIKMYLNIEKAKYESQLIITWDIDSDLDGFLVPPLLMQPLLENSIKHGFKNNPNPLTIKICIEKGVLIIKNNGSKLNLISSGEGLRLIKDRLNLHYNNAYEFSIRQKDNWVVNTIKIYAYL